MKTEEYKWGLRELYPSELRTDDRYQRKIKPRQVKRIVSEFNINIVNMPKVNLRDDGHYYIMDGDHTVTAWKQVYGNKPILCRVYTGLTWKEEAEFFLAQIGVHSNVTMKEDIKAKKSIGHEDVAKMYSIAEEKGVTISETLTKEPFQCVATESLFQVYQRIGPVLFGDVIDVIVKTWNGDSRSFSAGFIKGIGKFFELYSGRFEKKALVDSLKVNPCVFYEREAKVYTNGSMAVRYCKAFLKTYNKRRSANRLPDTM